MDYIVNVYWYILCAPTITTSYAVDLQMIALVMKSCWLHLMRFL